VPLRFLMLMFLSICRPRPLRKPLVATP
jgi:hypothetical protein